MRHFTNVHDLGDLNAAVKEALEVKSNRFAYKHLGQNKTLMMIFFNSSLRTRPVSYTHLTLPTSDLV